MFDTRGLEVEACTQLTYLSLRGIPWGSVNICFRPGSLPAFEELHVNGTKCADGPTSITVTPDCFPCNVRTLVFKTHSHMWQLPPPLSACHAKLQRLEVLCWSSFAGAAVPNLELLTALQASPNLLAPCKTQLQEFTSAVSPGSSPLSSAASSPPAPVKSFVDPASLTSHQPTAGDDGFFLPVAALLNLTAIHISGPVEEPGGTLDVLVPALPLLPTRLCQLGLECFRMPQPRNLVQLGASLYSLALPLARLPAYIEEIIKSLPRLQRLLLSGDFCEYRSWEADKCPKVSEVAHAVGLLAEIPDLKMLFLNARLYAGRVSCMHTSSPGAAQIDAALLALQMARPGLQIQRHSCGLQGEQAGWAVPRPAPCCWCLTD
ncbi:hypothetical protein N2152v2_004282 [Parachlorella kessleri]